MYSLYILKTAGNIGVT